MVHTAIGMDRKILVFLKSESLCCCPKLLEIVEIPKLCTHQVDYDITTVDELPTVVSRGLMSVVDLESEILDLSPKADVQHP